jgi:hypothetical protein
VGGCRPALAGSPGADNASGLAAAGIAPHG